MNRGGVGARSLNIELRAALNPAGDRKVERFGWTFAPGDKVMQIENDYDKEVYNGDIGFIDDVDPNAGEIVVRTAGPSHTGLVNSICRSPAYAVTIHKSQGSEYPAVIIPVMTQHYAMLQRNLLYTGVTAESGWSCWSGRKRPSPLPCATSLAGDDGQIWPSGCVLTRPSHGSSEANLRPQLTANFIETLKSAQGAHQNSSFGAGR